MTKSPLLLAFAISNLTTVDADIVINEIHSDPPEQRKREEFIELYNRGSESVDLSGWTLSGAVAYTIPESIVLASNNYLVLALDPEQTLFDGRALGPWLGRIDGDGERVVLRDADRAPVDEVDFKVRFPWPIASAGGGASMELIHPALGNDLGSSWRPSIGLPTPGELNSTFVDNPPPNIRQVKANPREPAPGEDVTVTVKVTDLDGVENVTLHYLIVDPGDYIPAYQPLSKSTLLADPSKERKLFSRYAEGLFTGRWPTIPMEAVDPKGVDGDPDNDGVFTVTLPGQSNRTLVRYYVTAEDGQGEGVRAPLEDDPSLNFAYFVYAGVPDWQADQDSSQGAGHVYSAEVLQQLPVYHLLVRNEDWVECLAYSGADQHPRSAMSARSAYNWSGTIVYDGEVYDNIEFRLRGGNGRYHLRGKRSMKFRFNKGNHFAVKDNRGRPYERKWRVLTTSKMYGNRLIGTFGTRDRPGNFGLVDTVNGRLWELFGVPAVRTHWFHFRVIDDAEEAPDQYGGDFYGLSLAQERVDVRFLESRDLKKGNLYKLTDQSENVDGVGSKGSASDGKQQQRYQAFGAPLNAEDYRNIFTQLRAARDDEWLRKHVNWDIWYRYTAVEEAIRHYDYWPDADKNMVYYFEPVQGNPLGIYWQLPYDSDASWGPSWNEGIDYAQNAIARRDDFQIEFRNTLREFRDLVWTPEVIGSLIDDTASIIADFHPADWDRWRNAPAAAGSEDFGTLQSKVEDMKLFAFGAGRTLRYPGGNVGEGGRAAFLDDLIEDTAIPKKPLMTFTGEAGYALDDLTFSSNAYRAASIFSPSQLSQVEWRVGEVSDAEAPAHDPNAETIYEITSVWSEESGTDLSIKISANVLKTGHTYRARVRHRDITNRVSHWSDPHEFTAEAPIAGESLQDSLVVTEIMYHPMAATDAEKVAGFDESDFEFIELWNRSETALDLTDVRFTKGIDFDFPAGTSMAPGAYGLLVSSQEGMSARYASDLPILGEWPSSFSLSNGGERLKLSFGAGNALLDFEYDDREPWPSSTDGEGYSLTVGDPSSISGDMYGDASSWRASSALGGTPEASAGGGISEPVSFADWLAIRGYANGEADPDRDGITHFGAYAMALDLLDQGLSPNAVLPKLVTDESGNFSLSVRQRSAGVAITLESSDDLRVWVESDRPPTSTKTNQDTSLQVIYELDEQPMGFWRVRFLNHP